VKRAALVAGIGLSCLCAGIVAHAQTNAQTAPKAPAAKAPATKASPNPAPARFTLTLAQLEAMWKASRTTQDYKTVGAGFEALLKSEPDNAQYRVRYADLLAARFNDADAEALYQEALKIDPKSTAAYMGLAEIYADSFDHLGAECAEKAIEIDPKLYQADEILARIALEDNNLKAAGELADAALAINSNALEAIAIHATIELLNDKPADQWVSKIGNRGEGYADMARALVNNRRYEDGIAYYRRAIAATPDLWRAHSQLGVNLMRFGREDEARAELKLAYDNDYKDAVTSNSLNLMDTYKDYKTYPWTIPNEPVPTGILKIHKKEADALQPYFEPEMKRAMATYEKKYGYKMTKSVQLEVFPSADDFAVRVMGLAGIGLLGVTFDNVVAMDGPSSRAKSEGYHWASVVWHELSHVYTIAMTNERVPRWFTEGVAVHEESATTPDWGDRITPQIVAALRESWAPESADTHEAPAAAGHGGGPPGMHMGDTEKKKLLSIADLDRGFVHPTYAEQVIVSYFEAGKICDYIVKRWGDAKLVDMIHAFAGNRTTVDVVREQLKMEPEQFDKDFQADLKAQVGKTVAGFETWTKELRDLNQAVKDDKIPADMLQRARALEELYPDYVEAGNAYLLAAHACEKAGDKPCEVAELSKYSRIGGRDLTSMELYADLLTQAGNKKDAVAALGRMIYVYPLDAGLHEKLGNMDLDAGNAADAVREFQVLLALNPGDKAGSHYNLAKALKADGQKDKAREEAITALETAPEFRPAQKLLLELSGDAGK